MIPVIQTLFCEEKGNCFAACIASILHLSIAEVPNFCGDFGDDWWEQTQEWLARRDHYAIEFNLKGEGPWYASMPPVHCIITGKSPRGDFLHCVVGRVNDEGIEYVHDPHPSGKYLAGPPENILYFGNLSIGV